MVLRAPPNGAAPINYCLKSLKNEVSIMLCHQPGSTSSTNKKAFTVIKVATMTNTDNLGFHYTSHYAKEAITCYHQIDHFSCQKIKDE